MSDTLLLRDERNQVLECEILKQVQLDGESYALLMPVHQPIQVLAWEEDVPESHASRTSARPGEDEDEGGLVDLDPEELKAVLPTAQAVLEELNLKLIESAYTLTVKGDLPEPIEETAIEIADDADEVEEYQLLSTFFHDQRQFGIFAPLDPLLFFAVQPPDKEAYLLSPNAPEELFARLQDRLLDLAE
ncbi:DUF3727 domain-containing protein [Synechococcus sp. PCC 7336]|uniref:DUF3727 domain-containing protein n=1 Tax=Synechococcus sp. PCC 7336 TaxID=195250 RepID=UPI00035E7BE4|nr:DUF3727 domain-containing protein [Synechococcus sp. PCC 7336]